MVRIEVDVEEDCVANGVRVFCDCGNEFDVGLVISNDTATCPKCSRVFKFHWVGMEIKELKE